MSLANRSSYSCGKSAVAASGCPGVGSTPTIMGTAYLNLEEPRFFMTHVAGSGGFRPAYE